MNKREQIANKTKAFLLHQEYYTRKLDNAGEVAEKECYDFADQILSLLSEGEPEELTNKIQEWVDNRFGDGNIVNTQAYEDFFKQFAQPYYAAREARLEAGIERLKDESEARRILLMKVTEKGLSLKQAVEQAKKEVARDFKMELEADADKVYFKQEIGLLVSWEKYQALLAKYVQEG